MTESDKPNESPAKRLLRAAAQFSAGQMIAMLTSIGRIALSAHVLSKSEAGLWLGIQLVFSYGVNLHLGSIFGAFRSIPMLRGKGDFEASKREEETTFAFVCVISMVAFPVLFVATRLTCPTASVTQAVGAAATVVIMLFRGYYNALFKALSLFKEVARSMVWGATVSALCLVAIYKWGLNGLMLSTAAQWLVELVFLAVRAPRLALRLNASVLVSQIRVGFGTLLTTVAVVFLTTIDRTVMIKRLGTDATGAYYIGANLMVLMPVIASMPSAVLTPQFFARYGRGESLVPLVDRPLRLASLGFASLLGVGSVATPAIISVLWPHLFSGSAAAQSALFATYPLVLAGLVSNVYYAHDKQWLHIAILLGAAGCGFGFAHLGVSLLHTITGAAVGAALGLYVYLPAAVLGAFWLLNEMKLGMQLLLQSLWPIAYAGGLSFVVGAVMARVFPGALLLQGLAGGALMTLAVLPLLWRARGLLRRGLAQSVAQPAT
ncbi:MAG: hypothetical protein Q8Q09_21795 [Deltaproteobacteria bacterium]|nr:hypothetical protein [Deltaproteobacteria bacterium]